MAARPESPHRQLSPEQRAQRDAAYRVDAQTFGDVLKVLVKTFQSLVTLNTTLAGAGQGYALGFPTVTNGVPGTIVFNRRHLRSANAQFGARIRQLKLFFQISMRKTKQPVPPSSFSGVYAPVYAGAALRAFFNVGGAGFGTVNPQQIGAQSLIDALPNAKNGWLMRNTTTLLFFAYAHERQLLDPNDGQMAHDDDVMLQVFGGTIPAAAFPRFLSEKVVKGKGRNPDKVKKIFEAVPMSIAIQSGVLTGPLNTYVALATAYPTFNPQAFNTWFFQNIASYNYYTRNMLAVPGIIVDPDFSTGVMQPPADGYNVADITNQFDNPKLRDVMLAEHNIAMNASAAWKLQNMPAQKAQRALRKKQQDADNRARGIIPGARAARPDVVLVPLGR